MRRGFLLVNLGIGALVLVFVGVATIPAAGTRLRVAEEVRAFKTLQRIAVAQHVYRAKARRFGSLADLLAPGPDGEPVLKIRFEEQAADSARTGEYAVAVLLPDAEGRPVSASAAGRVDAVNARRAFLAVAWPVRPDRHGWYAFACVSGSIVHEHPNPGGLLCGDRLPPSPWERLVEKDPEGGRNIVRDRFPEPWSRPLERVQARWVQEQLEPRGVPLPPAIKDLVEKKQKPASPPR